MISRMTAECLQDAMREDQPFEVIGRIVPAFQNGEWSFREEIFPASDIKTYPPEEIDYGEIVSREDQAVFLYYEDGKSVGQMILRKDWNRYVLVENLCVSRKSRGRGIGTALLRKAEEWAREAGLRGLALETQDNNLLACRFYQKYGMKIGGVNTMLYRNLDMPFRNETAVFWYKILE